jgi:hypothetical protein
MKSSSSSSSLTSSFGKNVLPSNITIIVLLIFLIVVIVLLYIYQSNYKNDKFFGGVPEPKRTGYWLWSWKEGKGSFNPSTKCDIGILFSGERPADAIVNNIGKVDSLTNARLKFLNLGGGGSSGMWQLSDFDYVNKNLKNIYNYGWDGICFDVEVCTPNVSFIKPFADCFAKCHAAKLKVLITISHTNPYACQSGKGQGTELVNSWITDTNVDFISPQLYSADGETIYKSDLSMFANAHAKIVPSIPFEKDWSRIQDLGIVPFGYIAWNRSNAPANNFCGSSWADAKNKCSSAARCISSDSECPNGQKCFGGIGC